MQSVDHLLHNIIEFSNDDSGASFMECVLIGSIIAVVGTLSLLALHK